MSTIIQVATPPIVRMGVIGTAGRKEDQSRLHKEHYDKMVDATIKLMTHLKIDGENLHLVSGGAAWSDHVVVTLALTKIIKAENLTLYLPAILGDTGYTGGDEWKLKTANTANYYHGLFSKKLGRDTYREILDVREAGASIEIITSGFKTRNSSVARFVSPHGHLLAFTFGSPALDQPEWTIRSFGSHVGAQEAGLKDGGTADTWGKAKCQKHHCRLGEIITAEF